jgi:hypothetical protein
MQTPFLPGWRARLAPLGSRGSSPVPPLRQATLAQIERQLAPAVDPALLQQRAAHAHSRERVFTLARTFWCWIWQVLQANTSCREVVQQVQALFALEQLKAVDGSSAAYCQARSKLTLGLLQKIFAGSSQQAEALATSGTLLRGRPLRLVDGTGLRLPDTPANRTAFPPPKNQPAGTGFPHLKVVALFSLASGAVLAHSIGSLRQSELRLFLCLRAWFKKGEVLILDRAYGIYLVAAILHGMGVDLVARVPTRIRTVDFRKARQRLGPNDALFVWQKPNRPSPLLPRSQWLALPSALTLRLVRVRINRKGFRIRDLTVVTSLLDPALYPPQEIQEAYLKRWRMEMCFDDLKTTLDMEYLSCLSPKMVHKELLVFLTAHNFLRWIMAQAAQRGGSQLERVSFKGCLDAFRQFTQALAQVGNTRRQAKRRDHLWQRFLQTLNQDLVPERPGRREPRAVKRKRKYYELNQPRHLWKDRLARHKRASLSRQKHSWNLN